MERSGVTASRPPYMNVRAAVGLLLPVALIAACDLAEELFEDPCANVEPLHLGGGWRGIVAASDFDLELEESCDPGLVVYVGPHWVAAGTWRWSGSSGPTHHVEGAGGEDYLVLTLSTDSVGTPPRAVLDIPRLTGATDTIRMLLTGTLPHADSTLSFDSIQVRFLRTH